MMVTFQGWPWNPADLQPLDLYLGIHGYQYIIN